MAHARDGLMLAIATVITVAPANASDGALSFEQRVQAREAVERVYYAHQIDATEPVERAVPRSLLESKVRGALAQEAHPALRVTDEMLESERARIVRDSRMPDRLQELFAALDHDPVLIREVLIRPLLVER